MRQREVVEGQDPGDKILKHWLTEAYNKKKIVKIFGLLALTEFPVCGV